jgi:hypothetical protein
MNRLWVLTPIQERFGDKLPTDLKAPKEIAVAEWRA